MEQQISAAEVNDDDGVAIVDRAAARLADAVLNICELIMPSRSGLSPRELALALDNPRAVVRAMKIKRALAAIANKTRGDVSAWTLRWDEAKRRMYHPEQYIHDHMKDIIEGFRKAAKDDDQKVFVRAERLGIPIPEHLRHRHDGPPPTKQIMPLGPDGARMVQSAELHMKVLRQARPLIFSLNHNSANRSLSELNAQVAILGEILSSALEELQKFETCRIGPTIAITADSSFDGNPVVRDDDEWHRFETKVWFTERAQREMASSKPTAASSIGKFDNRTNDSADDTSSIDDIIDQQLNASWSDR